MKILKKMLVLLCVLGLMAAMQPISAQAIPGDTEKELPDGGSSTVYTCIKVYGWTSGGTRGQAQVTCTLRYVDAGSYAIAGNNLKVGVENATVKQSVTLYYKQSGSTTSYTITESLPSTNLGTTLTSLTRVTSPSGYTVTKAYQYNYVSYTYYGAWRSYNQIVI